MDGVLIKSEYHTTEAAIRFFAEKGFSVKHEDFYPLWYGRKRVFYGCCQ